MSVDKVPRSVYVWCPTWGSINYDPTVCTTVIGRGTVSKIATTGQHHPVLAPCSCGYLKLGRVFGLAPTISVLGFMVYYNYLGLGV